MSTFFRCVPLVIMVLFLPLRGDSPVWWHEGWSPVILAGVDENPHGPATIGQAKWMAKQALEALNAIDSMLAAEIRAALTQAQPNPDGGMIPALLDFDVPADPLPSDWRERQHSPLLLGQLKAISAPFYQVLHSAAPSWLDHERSDPAGQGQLQLNGTKDPGNPTNFYPWTADTSDDDNHAIATIGQLKAVFSLRFESLDLDGDGLRDAWELRYFSNLDQTGDGDWDGDGLTQLQEQMLGSNPSAVVSDDNHDGIPDDWQSVHAGTFAVYPPLMNASLYRNQSLACNAYLSNDTDEPIHYSITLMGNTYASYEFEDSITGGASHAWQDISGTGTRLAAISDADDACESVDLTQFAFPFYGQNYNQVFISSNGLVCFGESNNAYDNNTLPTDYPDCAFIAAMWDDLDTRITGDIYYQEGSDRMIIQYDHVGKYGGGGSYTFQVILFDDGRIHLQYLELTGITDSCTIGIQNATMAFSLQVLHNESYLANQMAIEMNPKAEFFQIAPMLGSIPAHSIAPLAGGFRSLAMPTASYEASMWIAPDSDEHLAQTMHVRMSVLERPSALTLVNPIAGGTHVSSRALDFCVMADDADGVAKVEFFDGDVLLGESLHPPFTFWAEHLNPGPRSFMARMTDAFGTTTDSAPVSFTILADTDEDGMPDDWETLHGLNPGDPSDALTDDDGDFWTNLDEYLNAGNPHIVEDSDGDGMPDGWEIMFGLDVTKDDGASDGDGDELSHIDEFRNGTNPNLYDTDSDQLPDGWELQWGLNPVSATGDDGTYGDADRDGLTNIKELVYESNPTDVDTDSDDVADYEEINQGSFPNDSSDGGNAPDKDEMAVVKIIIGDPSGSHSERWSVKVKDLTTGKTFLNHRSERFGELSDEDSSVFRNFRKDTAYEFTLVHLGTDPELLEDDTDFFPDYDWSLEIGIQDADGNFVDIMDAGQKTYLVLDPWNPEKKASSAEFVGEM